MATATAVTTAAARIRAQQSQQANMLRQQQLQQQQQQQLQQQQLPMHAQQGQMPPRGLVSPYTGTSPIPTMGTGVPTLSGYPGARGMGGIGGIGAAGQGSPQLNATNQTALAPNGDVNQTVTNENQYVNKYYNIIMPYGGIGGGFGGALGGLGGLGGWNQPGNSFIDPKTGVLYVQKEQGFTGWVKRLFRGY